MIIYSTEQIDGLGSQISRARSIAYCVSVQECDSSKIDHGLVAQAALKNDINFATPKTDDLFYTRSILVTTTANNNDDIFIPEETWAARHTVVDKPTNISHDEKKIVGHATSSWVIDAEGKIVPDNVEEIPAFFHIANGAVIYKYWQDPEIQERVDALIDDIKNGNMFVSMECYFNDFDYAFVDDGQIDVVERNESTAFLTKHLRAYGGTGHFIGRRLGRVLKNINFSGKGYVERPANKQSVIFEGNQIAQFSFAKQLTEKTGVYTECKAEYNSQKETLDMSQEKLVADLNQKVADLEAQLADQVKANDGLKTKLEQVQKQGYEETIAELQAKVDELSSSLEASSDEIGKAEEAKACMCGQMEEMKREKEELAARLMEVEAEKRAEKRLRMLLDRGLSEETAAEKLEKLSVLDDEVFATMVSLISKPAEAEEKIAPSVENIEEEETSAEEKTVEGAIETEESENEAVFAATAKEADAYFSDKWLKEDK